ncbi:hemerythrin [Orenia metallireducens]|uniref:Hemerythrin n=1 Tax=Orenia metallireducens TaxID=1413210 RepID=A0A285F1Y5_9FIRM|nr:bacteriohemerythrin [Orenia metallireducens]PRX34714.1 hemerythrin [Orenia metallireducens]SNY05305.1 hemerythrin [Orenia metallireducens]
MYFNKLKIKDKILLSIILGLIVTLLSIGIVVNLQFNNFLEEKNVDLAGLKMEVLTAIVITFIVISVLLTVIMLRLSNYISKGLAKVTFGLKQLATGDLTIRLDVEKQDEFGVLYQAFNKSVKEQSVLVNKILEDAESLLLYSEILSASTEEGNAAIETTNQLIESMSASIQEVSASGEEVTSFAEESTAQTQSGKENMVKTVSMMEEINQKVKATVDLIKELNSNSEEIGGIIELITNVADQTNLLALNAAIEAARAGEHGQGFTVVAEEIRELAEETTKATVNVKRLIDNTRMNSKQVIEAIKEVEEKTQEGQSITENTNQIFTQIEEASEETTIQIEQIAYGAQDLANDSEALVVAAKDIDNMSQEINNSSNELQNKANDLKSLVSSFVLEDKVAVTKWSDKYKVGVEKIDEQHKGIFERANYLLDAYKNQSSEKDIEEVMDFLADYIDKHFREEEEIQRKYEYPDYENHKGIHHKFENKVKEVIADYKHSNVKVTSLMKLNKMVTGWLIEHIKREDQKLAKHIKDSQKS